MKKRKSNLDHVVDFIDKSILGPGISEDEPEHKFRYRVAVRREARLGEKVDITPGPE